jgi:hypothetical protein
MSLVHSTAFSSRPFLGAQRVRVSSLKSFERSVDLYGCFGNAHARRRVMRGSGPAETASKKSHRYPDGSSRSLPSHGSWIVGSPFYATSQACFCSAGGSAGCSPQRRVGPHSERCRNAGSGFSLSRTSSRGIPRTLQAHDPAHRLSDIFLLRFRNTRGRPWTWEGRLLLVCKFVAQSLGQRSQSGNGP